MPRKIRLSTAMRRGEPLVEEITNSYLILKSTGFCGCALGTAVVGAGGELPGPEYGSNIFDSDEVYPILQDRVLDPHAIVEITQEDLEYISKIGSDVCRISSDLGNYEGPMELLALVDYLHCDAGWPRESIYRLIRHKGF